MLPIAEFLTENSAPLVDPFPDEFGAQNSIISKLDQYYLVLKISSQSVHNFLSYCVHKQSITLSLDFIMDSKNTVHMTVGLLFSNDTIRKKSLTWTQKLRKI